MTLSLFHFKISFPQLFFLGRNWGQEQLIDELFISTIFFKSCCFWKKISFHFGMLIILVYIREEI